MDKSITAIKVLTALCAGLSALFMGLIVFVWDGVSVVEGTTIDPVKPFIGQGLNLAIFPFLLAFLASIGAVTLAWMQKKGSESNDRNDHHTNPF